jgi:hypothetical protein
MGKKIRKYNNMKENTGYNEKSEQRKYRKRKLYGKLNSLKREFNDSVYWNNYKMKRNEKEENTSKYELQEWIKEIKQEETVQKGPDYVIIYNTGRVPEGKFKAVKFTRN